MWVEWFTKNKEKVLKCEICEVTFTKAPDLKRHIESIHEGNGPFKCNICSKTFTHKYVMNSHITKVHEKQNRSIVIIVMNSLETKAI